VQVGGPETGERFLLAEALPRAPSPQHGRLCQPAAMTARTRRSCDLGMSPPSGTSRCRASCGAAERYPVGPETRKARSEYVGRTGFEPVASSVSGNSGVSVTVGLNRTGSL
jgi:hypothetical protein